MNIVFVVMSIFFITAIGYITIKTLGNLQLTFLEKIYFSFGLGIGACAVQLILYSFLAISWKPEYLLAPWVFIAGMFLVINRKKFKNIQNVSPFFSALDKILLLLLGAVCLYVLFQSQLRPLSAWDGWAIWLYKAKVFFIDGNINPTHTVYFENDYPHFLSLAIAYIYILIGKIDDRSVLLLFSGFYIATGLATFSFLKTYISQTKALILTFLLLSTQSFIRHGGKWDAGYADLPLGFFFLCSSILSWKYISSKNIKILILLQIFLAITSQIKNEGLPFSIIIELLLLFTLFRLKKLKNMLFFLIWLIPLIFWKLYKKAHVFYANYLFNHTLLHINRLPTVLIEIGREILHIQRWNFFWIFITFCFVLFVLQKKSKLSILFYSIFFLQLLVYVGIYLITPHDVVGHVRNTIDRLFLQIAPLVLIAAGITFFGTIE